MKRKCPIGYIEVNGRCVRREEMYKFNNIDFTPSNSFNGGGQPIPPTPPTPPPSPPPTPSNPIPTRKNKNNNYIPEIIEGVVGGGATIYVAKKGSERIGRMRQTQELDDTMEIELREGTRQRLLEEGLSEQEIETEMTPLLQRQTQTDELLNRMEAGIDDESYIRSLIRRDLREGVNPRNIIETLPESGIELTDYNAVYDPANILMDLDSDRRPPTIREEYEYEVATGTGEPPVTMDRTLNQRTDDLVGNELVDVDLTEETPLIDEDDVVDYTPTRTETQITDPEQFEDFLSGSDIRPPVDDTEMESLNIMSEQEDMLNRYDPGAVEPGLKGGGDYGKMIEIDTQQQMEETVTKTVDVDYYDGWINDAGEVNLDVVQEGLLKAGAVNDVDYIAGGLEALDLGVASSMGIYGAIDYAVTGEGNEGVAIGEGAAGTLGLVTAMAGAVGVGDALATGGTSLLIGGALYGISKGIQASNEKYSHKDKDYTLKRNKQIGSRTLNKKEIAYNAHNQYELMKYYEDQYKYHGHAGEVDGDIKHEQDKVLYDMYRRNWNLLSRANEYGHPPVVAIVDENGFAHNFVEPLKPGQQEQALQDYNDKGYWNYLSDEELALIGLDNIVQQKADDEAERIAKEERKQEKQDNTIQAKLIKAGIDVEQMKSDEYEAYKLARDDPTGEAMIEFDEKWASPGYTKAQFERQIEAEQNDGKIMVYSEGTYAGLTKGEVMIRENDPNYQKMVERQHANNLAESEGHGQPQDN
jgi:hypothetical protein